ncbi:MAG: CoA transferase [Rhodobiaceae bacterium]|jgi:crotonobetainyl-CoA:carnitine CoA-transferase CaiB-like acyl-CoA transferase|nr:CoA transferase [Rhodobiaceae bacterium]MBT7279926.1 CoA transferase [Rhodobiaceae bacterium]
MQTKPTAEKPLAGLKVIEMSTMITCAYAAMMLRSQGAQVIKVEPAQMGDPMRYVGSQKNGQSALFHNCNRGKQSLAIDLKHENGAEAVKRLVKDGDIMLNNYRPGVMDNLGLGSEAMRAINPRLINVAVTGFGTVGPMATRPAYDHVIQGISGLTGLQGGDFADPNNPEYDFVKMLICDKVTAYTVAQAATAALVARATTGEGQHIDISMLHACLAFMWPDGMMSHTLQDEDAVQMPPLSESYKILDTKDGSIACTALTDGHWAAILKLLDREDLISDPRFASLPGRMANFPEIMTLVRDGVKNMSLADVLRAFQAADIPSAPCESRTSVMANEQVLAIGALETYVTENMGQLTAPTPPVLFGGNATSLAEPSPRHGEHSQALMATLGFDAAVVQEMTQTGALLCG